MVEKSPDLRDDTPMSEAAGSSTGPSVGPRNASQVRNQPVKRYDGEPLTRTDVQHAMLCYLFSDTRRVFTNPRPGTRGAPMSSFVQNIEKGDDTPSNEADRNALKNAPPAVQASVAAAMAGPFPTYVWPYGQSAGSARRADESPAELEAWKERREAYMSWRDTNYPSSITPTAELEDDAKNSPWEHPGAEKLTFKELYIEALMNSSKCTKSMREKCFLDEEYAEDFSKVCLLVNVGRINTTLAFYPEMKTILRSYHPVPSLQKSENTRRNMQDAPRMKSLLKAVLLPYERPGPPGGSGTASASARHDHGEDTEEVPTDLAEVARRLRRSNRPPTSVVTLIFLLTQQAPDVMGLHFPPTHDMHSLFFPQTQYPISAKDRANTFLWLLYHYLEGPAGLSPGAPGTENPFDDDVSRAARMAAHDAWVQQGSTPLDNNHPLWRGLPNPEYAQWREKYEHLAEAQNEQSTRRASRKRQADTEDLPVIPPCPESHTHRLLIPSLPKMNLDAYLREDQDPPEEVAWGKQMQGERSAFLVRFQEEEQAKVLAQSGILDDPEHGRADEAKPKKRISMTTQSCYPLANILANAAAAGSHAGALTRSPIGFVKRARLSSRQSHSRERGTPSDMVDGENDSQGDSTPSLWDLDLSASDTHTPSLVDEAWEHVKSNDPYDSDSEMPSDTEAPLARTLLVLRRIRETRGDVDGVSSSVSATSA
ncbi:hypothetical protein Malapachy_3925 [Malassezia pachydermatis]|uniref:Ino eighty subunit 1 n=1 Tax=Malassezia pachydermatis TaxID=77020 RepID=A0A0M9VPC5_9BASI|nr:hypothetical protein Malapachy_3925 [Malassezia pachydermatis]KOS14292.1 hypothetical protein Malapachy_3925 [Malassezia pachydermatis]